MAAGSLTDRFGNRLIINLAVTIIAVDFALMPFGSASVPAAGMVIAVWGLFGWGFFAPQQHRLIGIAPAVAPVLLALNSSTIYVAGSAGTALGALALSMSDPRGLPILGSALMVGSLVAAESAHWLIANRPAPIGSSVDPIHDAL